MGKFYDWLNASTKKWYGILMFGVGLAAFIYYSINITGKLDEVRSKQDSDTTAKVTQALSTKEDSIRDSQDKTHRWLKDSVVHLSQSVQGLSRNVAEIKRGEDTIKQILRGITPSGEVGYDSPSLTEPLKKISYH